MTAMARKTREQRAAEYHRTMAQVERSEAERRSMDVGDDESALRYAGRSVLESLLLGVGLLLLVVVPAGIGLAAAGTSGLWIGLAVGVVLAGAAGVYLLLAGARGVARAARR